MTRVLQIRRGTTAQHEKFTGMPGELSFDTDKNTLVVHDGKTLGGIELAKKSNIGNANGGEDGDNPCSEFDINTVPPEFWEKIIAVYGQPAIKINKSRPTTIANVAYLEYIFNLSGDAKFAQATLVCQTPEAGYSIGDTIAAFGIGARTNPLPNTFTDNSGLHARLMVGGEEFWVSHKESGVRTNITNNKWKVKFTVWY